MSFALLGNEYAADHAKMCRDVERQRRHFAYTSPQAHFRPYLVSWMRIRAEKLKLCTCAVHLAVYLLDIFMDNHHIEFGRLHLVTLACLQVACKYEEWDTKIPRISDLNKEVNDRYLIKDFHDMEIMLLKFLDWNLNLPTAAHFATYFSLFSVTRKDWDPSDYVSYETFWKEAQRAVKDFLDLSLMDVNMMEFKPSLVASACILLARQQLRLDCKWTNELISVTEYVLEDLILCANTIFSRSTTQTKRKVADSPDVGYVTGGSDSSSPDGPYTKRRCTGQKKY